MTKQKESLVKPECDYSINKGHLSYFIYLKITMLLEMHICFEHGGSYKFPERKRERERLGV